MVDGHLAVDVIVNGLAFTCIGALTGLGFPAGIKELFFIAVYCIGVAINRQCVVELVDLQIAPVAPSAVGELEVNLLLADSLTLFLCRSRKSARGNRKSRCCH